MNEDQILDQPMDEADKKKDVMRNLAGGGKRFANWFIDVIGFYIAIFLFGVLSEILGLNLDYEGFSFTLLTYLLYVLYYWTFESLTDKSLGKYITRTRIVKEDGSSPDALNILGRSFSRLIPFDALSFLGTPGKGWHDSVPKIYVINEN